VIAASFQGFQFTPSTGDNNDNFVFWLNGIPFSAPEPDTSDFIYWEDGYPFNGDTN
jgi:hypothetical protein